MSEHSTAAKKSVEELQEKDYQTYGEREGKHPLLSDDPDVGREDTFDVAYGPHELHRLDIHRLKGEGLRPVVVFIHGGGWARRDKDLDRFVAHPWIEQGYAVVSINYRLTDPGNPDPALRNTHPTQIDDCARALKWMMDNIQNYGGDPERIAITGHSAGAHLATLLVADSRWHERYGLDMDRVKCWMSLSGIHDLNFKGNYEHPMMVEYIDAFLNSEEQAQDASPIVYFSGKEAPGLLAHGTADYLVPPENSKRLFEKLSDLGIATEFHEVPGGMHMDYFSRMNDRHHVLHDPIRRFLKRYLR